MGIKMKSDEKILGVLQAVNRLVVSQIEKYNVTRSVPHFDCIEYVVKDELNQIVVTVRHDNDYGATYINMKDSGKETSAVIDWYLAENGKYIDEKNALLKLINAVEKRYNQIQKQNNDIDNTVNMVKKLKLPADKAGEIIKLLNSQRIR